MQKLLNISYCIDEWFIFIIEAGKQIPSWFSHLWFNYVMQLCVLNNVIVLWKPFVLLTSSLVLNNWKTHFSFIKMLKCFGLFQNDAYIVLYMCCLKYTLIWFDDDDDTLNMTYLHCLQHSLFEHLFNLYC